MTPREAELIDALERIRALQPKALAMLERTGTVIDKWPPLDDQMPPWNPDGSGREGWTPERLAALEPEVRWQGIVFSLYVDLCQAESIAGHAIEDDE